ncbi:FAD-binding oxidoreductase [Hoeflea sp. YIM 152468]|uniref:NAD(P)/FAD-dependent oxidoreductase n=1 Tax=Hoeflea sp. YIM 152468 TaxID=3031759 RepID=UPI0023DAF9EE|nr:FAD-binding oxidoreductase [Hoeflea sp. YIM 152468]MDF1608661.1 FAD-binding oxidoreductase [Hoeflea sp. YIM 152468]
MSAAPFSVLWRTSSCEQIDTPPLSRNMDVDLVIIGGGFTGTSAALEAARNGASVCLLEAETIGYGGSGRNVGLVNAGLWLPPDAIIEHLGETAAHRLIDVLGNGPGDVFALIEREGIDCEATRCGTLHLAHSASGFADLEDRCRQGKRHEAPLSLLEAEETARRTGTNAFFGALFDPRAGTIQPLAYCRGLARAAQAQGATISEHSTVTALRHETDRWLAACNGHTVRARNLLVATNAYHLGITAPFTPGFTTMNYCQFATAPLAPADRANILSRGEGCWDTAMVMSSIRIDRAGRLIIGGVGSLEQRGSSFHRAWARRKLRKLYPHLPDLRFEHGWSGRIAMTSDHIPKIVHFGPGAYAVFGYSGRGIAPGTVFGRAIARALLQDQRADLPLPAIETYSERHSLAKARYYEMGAKLVHGLSARF